MNLFDNTILVYITNVSAQFISLSKNTSSLFDYPKGTVIYGEMIDEEQFINALDDFFKKLGIRGKAVLVLSHELVFFESAEANSPPKQLEDEFYSYVPFRENATVRLIVKNRNQKSELFAANEAIYQAVIKVLKMNGVEVKAVVPLQHFIDENAAQVTQQQAKQILGKSTDLSKYNLLSVGMSKKPLIFEPELSNVSEDKSRMGKQYVVLFTTLFFFICALLYALISLHIIPTVFFTKKASKSKTTSEKLMPTDLAQLTPTIQVIDKKKIKIQILNGSGVVGQANKTKQNIQNNGYLNIETGNATTATNSETIVQYDKSVDRSIVDNIMNSLKELYQSVSSDGATLENFDVIITTGKERK